MTLISGVTRSCAATMNSYRPNNNRRGGRGLLWFVTIFVIIIVIVDLATGGAIRSFVGTIGSSIWRGGDSIASRIVESGFFDSRAKLVAENEALSAQVNELQGQTGAYQVLVTENAQLTTLVHLASTEPGITAPVISSFRASPYGTFEIGAGSAETVDVGALVQTSDGFVVGTVTHVSLHESLVTETFASGSSIDVLIGTTPLTLQGQGDGNALGQLPAGASVSQGAVAFAPSLGQRPVGIVGYISSGAGSASTDVRVQTPTNLQTLSYVYVETAPQ